MEVNPFTINVPDKVLEDLSRRLENVRWPDQTTWISRKNRGCPLTGLYASLKEVLATRAAKYSRSVLAPYGFDAQGGRFGKADKFIVLDWETAD